MLPERKDIGRALTADQELRLLEETAKTEDADSPCHTATVLALNTTMGTKEIRTLTWGQVDFAERIVTVGLSKNRSRTGRPIPLNRVAFEALVRWAGRFPESQAEPLRVPLVRESTIRRKPAHKGLAHGMEKRLEACRRQMPVS